MTKDLYSPCQYRSRKGIKYSKKTPQGCGILIEPWDRFVTLQLCMNQIWGLWMHCQINSWKVGLQMKWRSGTCQPLFHMWITINVNLGNTCIMYPSQNIRVKCDSVWEFYIEWDSTCDNVFFRQRSARYTHHSQDTYWRVTSYNWRKK